MLFTQEKVTLRSAGMNAACFAGRAFFILFVSPQSGGMEFFYGSA